MNCEVKFLLRLLPNFANNKIGLLCISLKKKKIRDDLKRVKSLQRTTFKERKTNYVSNVSDHNPLIEKHFLH